MASISTVKMTGPSGNLITVNEPEVEIYEAKGYELFVESRQEDPVLDEDEAQQKAVEDMRVPELRDYAEDNDIDISGLTKKADIIEAIQQAEAELDEEPETDEEPEPEQEQ